MQTKKKTVIVLFTLLLSLSSYTQNRVAISDKEDQQAHPSAILELISENKGFLLPRMTEDEKNAINNPAESLMIFNTETECIEIWVEDWFEFWCLEIEPVYCGLGEPTEIVDVTNPVTGKTWMDRNLGASRACISSDDEQCFGDLFQWGRYKDGHQCRDCAGGYDEGLSGCDNDRFTFELSESDTPGHTKFILNSDSPNDWRDIKNDNLWQGDGGINDPCPDGYRLPTEIELQNEIDSWSSEDAIGAFNSELKLPAAGRRGGSSGTIFDVGSSARYRTSSVDEIYSPSLLFDSSEARMFNFFRANGFSVRCIKD